MRINVVVIRGNVVPNTSHFRCVASALVIAVPSELRAFFRFMERLQTATQILLVVSRRLVKQLTQTLIWQ